MSHAITVRLSSGRSYCSGVLIAPDLTGGEATTEYVLSCAHFLRERTGLRLSAGGVYRGNGGAFLRMNLACPRARLQDGLERLKRGVEAFAAQA